MSSKNTVLQEEKLWGLDFKLGVVMKIDIFEMELRYKTNRT